jgi:hypothetical protein
MRPSLETRPIRYAALFLTCLAILVGATGCASSAAMENVTFPTARTAWVGVKPDVQLGVSVESAVEKRKTAEAQVIFLDTSLATSDVAGITAIEPHWPNLEQYGKSGIAARASRGEIGPGVVTSLHERLKNFGAILKRIAGRP